MFVEEGHRLTPREIFYICTRMIDLITDLHKEGLVMDTIDSGFLVLGLDEKVSITLRALSHWAKAKKIKEWSEEIKDKNSNIKENFAFTFVRCE